jgi:hypothetical protein
MKNAILTLLLLTLPALGHSANVKQIAKSAKGFAVQSEPSGVYLGATSSALGCIIGGGGPDEAQKGIVVGCTYHDFQKYGSMGRQISTDQIFHVINFAWTEKSNNSLEHGLCVRYEGFYDGALGDGTGGVDVGGGGCFGSYPSDPNERLGFVTLAGVADGTTLETFHWNRIYQGDPTAYKPYVFKNETPGLRDFAGFGGVTFTGQVPDSAWDGHLAGNANTFIWPQIAYTDFGATQVAHLVISSDRTDGDNTALYLRRVGSADWETMMELGPAGFHRSFVVTNSRTSERVGIAFSGGRGDGTSGGAPISRYDGTESGQNDNDIYVILSNDAGATWGPLQNITQRPDSAAGGFVPHAKLSALVDIDNNFHVVWQARLWNGYDGELTTQSRMYHWDDVTQAVRVAVDGVYETPECQPGFQQLNTDNPQLSECAGNLFLTFSMFAPTSLGLEDDCAARAYSGAPNAKVGAANADIFVAVSDNNGFNWDPPRNLTQTYTPNCDTFPDASLPDCGNEVWHSVTRYGIDVSLDNFIAIPDFSNRLDPAYPPDVGEYLFVQYVDDIDPGAAPLGEGGWHDNPLRSFRFGCVDIIQICILGSSLAEGQAVDDPTYVLPGTSSEIEWELSNICSHQINYALSIVNQSPPGNITVTGGDGVIGSGISNTEDLVISLNANLETIEQHAHAEIVMTGNMINGNPAGTMTFLIDYTIGDIQQLVPDTLADVLIFDNRGNIGRQSTSRLSMDLVGDPAECDSTAESYLFEGSPIVSFPGDGSNIIVSSMFNNGFVDSSTFRPLATPTTDDFDESWTTGSTGEMVTQDSALGLTVNYWRPKEDWVPSGWEVVFVEASYYNRSASPLLDVYCAYGWDWDVPSETGGTSGSTSGIGNKSGFVLETDVNLMYQRGVELGLDTGVAACVDRDRRFAAVSYFTETDIDNYDYFNSDSGAGVAGFQALYTRHNQDFVGAEWVAPRLDSMLQNISGFSAYSTTDPADDQNADLHMVMNAGSYDIYPGDTVKLFFAMTTGIATGDVPTDLTARGQLVYNLSPWNSSGCCDTPGDADNSGVVTIGDATYLIAHIFSGGSGPICCAEGDCNRDGTITIEDVTCMIWRIFLAGPEPVCGPREMTCEAI